jgi:putative endonuclease
MRPGGRSRTPRARTPKQRAGDRAEDAALAHLAAAGCRLIARNARYPDVELDLIVRDGELLAFVEVDCVTRFVRRRCVASTAKRNGSCAPRSISSRRPGERWPACRFDVVTVNGDGT